MEKRGISSVFAWIFIMIAGALMILLFTLVANYQAERGKESLAVDALQKIESIIATQVSSSDSYVSIPIPAEKIRIACEPFSDVVLSQIEIEGFSSSLENKLVVGRDMESDNLLLFSKRIEMPYALGNILFVSNEEEILVINDDDSGQTNAIDIIKSEFPETVKQVDASETINSADFDNTRVVIFTTVQDRSNNALRAVPTRPATVLTPKDALYIHVASDDILKEGTVTYKLFDGPNNPLKDAVQGRSFHYVGKEMLLALIWQADAARAECFTKKLTKKIEEQTNLQIRRLQLLNDEYLLQSNTVCPSKYVTTPFNDLISDVSDNDYSDVLVSVEAIESRNEGILRGARCATIY